MKISIPYGSEKIELELPAAINIKIVSPNKISSGKTKDVIKKALDNPMYRVSFGEWVAQNSLFLFIINDATRPTPTLEILKELDRNMNLEEAKYIIATGAHKEPTDSKLALIFGEFYDRVKTNILIHNARGKKSLIKLGITERGTEVWLNKEVLEAKALIPIGSVGPHYFAGFTGGRKSFIPGVAGYVTIEQNHKLALEEGAAPLYLSGNPVHLDLLDAFETLPCIPIFSIQTIVKDEKNLCAVFCGDIYKSFSKACEYAKNVFCTKVKEKVDIVITVAKRPLDENLYQAHKAIEHGKLALKNGGILILVSLCKDGIGPGNFYKLLSSSTDPEKILTRAKEDYRLGYHKAARIAELSKKAEICVVSEIEDKILKDAFMKPFGSLQEAVNQSLSKKGKDSKILIIMDGASTVPKVM
jgi:nickel-dependent lactate racemase